MIKQSDLALAAWKATERTLDAVVTINKIDYKTTDIASISYDAGGYTGDTFGIGSNYENSVTIKFSHLIEGLKPGMTVWPKIGIKTSNGYEYSSLGLFIVSDDIQMDRNNDETTIKAYDQMCLLEGTYTSKLTYPAKMTSVIAEIANLAGVLLNTTDISRLPVQVNLPSAITGQTYRNAIGMIAQFYAGFATFDRDGKLTIRTITEPDYTLDPSQYEQGGLTKNEAPYKIGGIQCEVTTTTTDSTGQSTETTNTLQVGAASGSQIKLTNNLMTMDRLASIWQQLQSLTFYPFSLNWFGNPAIEAGDWLTLQDTKGNKFNVPNNGYTMTFDGSLSAVSKADQTSTSSSSYAWRGELSQYVADLGGRQGASGNYIYGTDTTEPPYGAKFNDIWYKQNGNKIELWTYERQADGTGKWVLTVSDSTGEEVKAKVDQVELEAKASTDAAKAASDKADQLAAKYDDTNALANQALGQAVGAQSDASAAVATANSTASEFGKVSQKTDSALTSAVNAQSDASAAVATANSTASEFGKVSQKTDSALTSAVNAQSAASDAVKQASSAAADSKDAKQIAGAVSQSYKTLTDGSTMTIAELQNGLAAKLTKTDLDGYATQTWAQNQIKMTADGINGTMSSIKSTVDGQTTSINDLQADSSSFKSQFTTVNNDLGKQTTDIGTLQATSKELTTGFNTLTTDNTTNKNDISQLKQTATEVSSTLETVQTQVQNSAVGTNLLLNTGDDNDATHPVKMLTGYVSVLGDLSRTKEYSQITAPPSGSYEMYYRFGNPLTNEMYGLEPEQTYTIQGKVYVSKGSVHFRSQYQSNSGWNNYSGNESGDLATNTSGFVKVNYTFTIPANATAFYISWQVYNFDSTTVFRFRRMKLEKGSLATDFSTNPLDNATVAAVSNISQTVDGMKADISKKIEQKDLNGYATEAWAQNKINATADGINATVSSVKSTVDGQTTSINDLKADSSSFKTQFTTVNNTIGKHTTDIGTLQATSKELTTGFNTLTTDNGTNKNNISRLSQTVDGMKSDISKKIEQKDLNGYATETWTQNKINATADGINGTLSSVKGTVDGQTTSINDLQADSRGFKAQFTTVNGTLGKQSTDISTLQETSKSLTASFDSLSSDNTTNKHNISQLQASATAFNSTLMTVQQQVTDSAVGTNLLANTADNGVGHVSVQGDTSSPVYNASMTRNDSYIEMKKPTGSEMYYRFCAIDASMHNLKPGQTYTIQGEVYVSKGSVHFRSQYQSNGGWANYSGNESGDLATSTSGFVKVKYTFTIPANATAFYLSWQVFNFDSTTVFRFRRMKLEVGVNATDYSTSPLDNATVTAVSSISQTIDSIQTTVRGKVDNDVYQSKVTQLNNQITSVVGKVDTFGTRNFVTNSQFQYDYLNGQSWTGGTTDFWYKSDFAWSWVNGYQGICINKPVTTDTNTWYNLFSRKIVIGQDISTPWSASAYVNVDAIGYNAILIVEFYDTKGNRIGYKESQKNTRGLELRKVENVVPPAGTETVCLSFRVHGGGHVAMICPMLNQGATAAAYVPDNVSNAELEHAYSAILQTNDRINLRVEKNGVINAINISPEGTKIYGTKLHITADTYIDNAIIKNSMIESIDAGKITAGTINAAHINVINLNANNITTGTIKGSNLSINLNTGNVEFQAGRIHSSDNAIDININNKYISVADKDNRVFISGGEIQMIQPTLFSSQSTPYVRISNAQAGASWGAATFWARDYFVVTHRSNDGDIFTSPMGEERFSGISGGHSTSGWQVTKIGGAERGVLISGGHLFTDGISISPYIRVGDSGHAGAGMNGSNISMQASYIYLKSTHTSSRGANAYLAPDGALVPSTSAAKYKTDIVRSFETGMGDKLLEVPVAHWKDKEEVLAKTLDPNAKNPETYFGMIADDLDDAGLNELVEYDDKGVVRSIQYDRVALALIPLIRNYRDRITELEIKVKEMKEV
ncbi:gp58-like family protein [Lactiplantibacillus plantarum]|uniref:gp58-like family protein n=1 Tax=Lactiplantibacillus plantarum TaxID=1590 RepID=UPI001CDC7C52|nr:gp58-like family protein [Lactiplantibacillus plantarum]UVO56457.1 gp58-like family protein [Lactiplantibacillus plantarum]WBF39254.1 gp58-like family protein [Lactiplantibacillus plantarum]